MQLHGHHQVARGENWLVRKGGCQARNLGHSALGGYNSLEGRDPRERGDYPVTSKDHLQKGQIEPAFERGGEHIQEPADN